MNCSKSNFMIKHIVIIIVGIFFQTCYGSNVISLSYSTTDIEYSKIHGKLYALVDAMDTVYGNQIIEINITTGAVERSQFVGSEPFLMRLTSDENYAWISFYRIPFVRRINLNTFQIDKEIYLGPSRKDAVPKDRFSTILAYNFTVFPDQTNELALCLKTPFDFDFEAISLYRNDTIQPKRIEVNATSYPPFCIEPVLNGNYLIGHHQDGLHSVFSGINVLNNGFEYKKEDVSDIHGDLNNWFKVHNDTLYTADGTILDATDTSNLKVLGNCKNEAIGDRYGFAFSCIRNAFVYPNIYQDSLYLTFYNKNTFEAFDSVYLLNYPYKQSLLISELEVIDRNRFAILIRDDYGNFTVRIIETFPLGIETNRSTDQVKIFPNPASDNLFISGCAVNKNISFYDVTGKLLGTFNHSGMRAEINLKNYEPGIYVVKVTDIDNSFNSVIKKLVIQK